MRNVVVYTLMFSAMVQFLLAAYAWGRRNEPGARPAVMLFILGGIFAFAYGMDMASSDLNEKMFWTKVIYSAASFGPFTFLLITFEHLEIKHLFSRTKRILALVPSLVIIALVWTMPHHKLLLYDFSVEQVGPLEILQKKDGVLFAPIFLSLQALSLIAYYYLIRSFSRTNAIKRRQSIAIFFAILTPFVFNLPTILDISPVKGFDFTPQALVITSGLFALAIFRYRWLDLLPLARTALVESIPMGVVVLDAKNRIVDINPAAQQILHVVNPVAGQEALTVFAQLDPSLLPQTEMSNTKKEITVRQQGGQMGVFEVQVVPLTNPSGQFSGRIVMLHEITDLKQSEAIIHSANANLKKQLFEIESLHAQLREQAIRDALTGLFNRAYMNEALEGEIHRAERYKHPFGVLMIEIDSFKNFNDRYGHEVGDAVLRRVAELIQASTRTGDIACRYGGDEFILILPETPLVTARRCAERLQKDAMRLTLNHGGTSLGALTLSIGVAAFPVHGGSGASILRAADEAMYRAKQTGKNKVLTARPPKRSGREKLAQSLR